MEGAGEREPLRTEFEQMAVFRKKTGPGLPIEATLTLTDAVRTALMSNAGNGGPMTDLIHGHNADTHCAVVGLPFVGRKHADGHLMGFAVVFPRATETKERVAVLRACKALEERGVNIPRVGDWEVEVEEEAALNQSLRAATWISPARVWLTVTPILLDRFPKKKGPGVEDILAASCRRIGLPDPVGITHGPYSEVDGVPPVPAFRLQRAGEVRARWGVHARLEFATAVRGPMVLGAGRYFGLGFLRPEREKQTRWPGLSFAQFYKAVHGRMPFPWQERLAARALAGDWPGTIAVPTGCGKTSVIDVAVFALAAQAGIPAMQRTARLRTFFVVDRRLVVDDVSRHAEGLAEAIETKAELQWVKDQLLRFGGACALRTAVLRGGMYRSDTWADIPNQPLVCVSTVDQVGSRLLFRGYGISDSRRPIHAGLVGSDALMIVDEAHLSRPFLDTLGWVERYQGDGLAEGVRGAGLEVRADVGDSGGNRGEVRT